MTSAGAAIISHEQRIAIFWGGGLGDILVLRPMLMALQSTLARVPVFFTTSDHLPHLLAELRLRAELHILPRQPRAAIRALREERHAYDLLYLGPYPTIPTRLLARTLRTHRIWQKRHPETSSFVGEQVLADVRAFGLEGPDSIHESYGGDWDYETQTGVSDASPYLLLHPGAKGGWETKRWPDACWSELMRRILAASNLQLVLVGLAAELPHLQALLDGLTAAECARVAIQAGGSLQELASAVRGSAGVICHNSGVMHLAAMLGRPTLALTGSSPQCWRPPYAHVQNLTSGRCGLACNQYRCPVPFYRARCIKQLSVTQVLLAARTHFTIL